MEDTIKTFNQMGGIMDIKCQICGKITSSQRWDDNKGICPICCQVPVTQYQKDFIIMAAGNAIVSIAKSLETLAKWCEENWVR